MGLHCWQAGGSEYVAQSSGHFWRSRGTGLHPSLSQGRLTALLGEKQHRTEAERQEQGFL